MRDIVDRLEEAIGDGERRYSYDSLLEEAMNEIQRLRALIDESLGGVKIWDEFIDRLDDDDDL